MSLLKEEGMSVITGTIKSTYRVIFVRHTSSPHLSYAVKVFPTTMTGKQDFTKESITHALLSESPFVAKAIECVDFISGMVPPVTLGPDGPLQKEYSYIMMPLFQKDTLLALLMRANYNNNKGREHKLSMMLQRYFCLQLC